MNQILYMQKNNKKSVASNIEITKIIRFFAIALIVFGVTMMGQGIYAASKNADYRDKLENATPTANLERVGQYLVITASHVRPIASIEYSWNNDDEVTIEGNNRTSIVERIELPAGNNSFHIVVTDVKGKQTTYDKEFSIETGRDIKKPAVEMNLAGNYVKITATDDMALSYITYRWNDEEETKIEPNGADNAKIETSVEILKGRNTLTVSAVDSSNNVTTREQPFEGVTKPTVEVYVDGDSFLIIAKHEISVDHIEYTLNGQKYSIRMTPGPEMQYRQKMAVGYNHIIVEAHSVGDIVATKEGEYTYTPEQ